MQRALIKFLTLVSLSVATNVPIVPVSWLLLMLIVVKVGEKDGAVFLMTFTVIVVEALFGEAPPSTADTVTW